MKSPPHTLSRTAYEKRVIHTMIGMYCHAHHHSQELCPSCRELLDYCISKIDRCPLHGAKSSCRQCSIHCYQASYRDQVRRAMRYAGPRMILRHPLMTLRHLFYERIHRPAVDHPAK